MTDIKRLRDYLPEWVPWWLSDRKYSSGKTVGYRVVWTLIHILDYLIQWSLEALQASWPGFNATALPLIGRTRGIIRNQVSTDDEFATKLISWLDRWRTAGSARRIAIELHEYLSGNPRIRIVNRNGTMVTVETDGTITQDEITWDWDSVSNPERSGFWSEMWVIIYPTPFAIAGNWGIGTWGDAPLGFGHDVDRQSVDAVKGILAQWKSAHSMVRAVIWTSNATLFNPADPPSLPNGNWGMWSDGTGQPSDRRLTDCRYWEPEN